MITINGKLFGEDINGSTAGSGDYVKFVDTWGHVWVSAGGQGLVDDVQGAQLVLEENATEPAVDDPQPLPDGSFYYPPKRVVPLGPARWSQTWLAFAIPEPPGGQGLDFVDGPHSAYVVVIRHWASNESELALSLGP